MTDAIHTWGAAEWWLFFTIVGLFAVFIAAGLFQARPAWMRRLRQIEQGRQRQGATHAAAS